MFVWMGLLGWSLVMLVYVQGAYYCPANSSVYGRLCLRYSDKCQVNDDCVVPGHGCCFVPTCGKECFNLARPRVCPKPPPIDIRSCSSQPPFHQCMTDEDCIGEDKICCPTGNCHIKLCVYPPRYGRPNPGVCPKPKPPSPKLCLSMTRVIDCIRDTDCQGGKKCCPVGCGSVQCKAPILDRPECPFWSCVQYEDRCKSDADCQNAGEICCYNPSCGRKCWPKSPVSGKKSRSAEKPGICQVKYRFDCGNAPDDECISDFGCPDKQKCCYFGCSMRCRDPK